MSAIGNYVHLSYAGYHQEEEAGKKIKSGGPYYKDARKALSAKRIELENRINRLKTNHNYAQIEKKYNNILNMQKILTADPNNDNKNLSEGEMKVMESMKEAMDSIFNREMPKFIMDNATLTVNKNNKIKTLDGTDKEVKGAISYSQKQKAFELETFLSRIQAIEEITGLDYRDIDTSSSIGQKFQAFKNEFNAMNLAVKKKNSNSYRYESSNLTVGDYLTKKVDSPIQKEKNTWYLSMEKMVFDTASHQQVNQINKLRKQLNQIIGMLYSSKLAALGFSLEVFGAAGGIMMKKHAYNIATEEIEKSLKGRETAMSVLQINNFARSKKIADDIGISQGLQKEFKYGENGEYQATIAIPTQNKVDFTIENKGGSVLGVSAKNYSFKRAMEDPTVKIPNAISVQSSGSLLYYLQNENTDNFVNHYINLVTWKQKTPHGDETLFNWEASRDIHTVQEAHKLTKILVMLKALTGDNVQKWFDGVGLKTIDNAQAFMVNNTDEGKIYFISMADLLNYFLTENKGYELYNYKEDFLKAANKKAQESSLKNDKGKKQGAFVYDRIGNVLKVMHQLKIKPYVYIDAIQNISIMHR